MELKKQLRDMGIKVEGNYVRKKDIESVVASNESKWKGIVDRMSKGETVTMSEADYDQLIDYLDKTDHKYSNKLASLWNKGDPKKLDAFFKGLSNKNPEITEPRKRKFKGNF